MSEIDWDKAPEGATHWMPGSYDWKEGFWKRKGGENYFHTGEAWYPSGAKPFGHPKLIPRPSPSWSGEGLPPVGVVCEFQSGMGGWSEVEITAIAKLGVCFVQRGREGENYVSLTAKFRPIRTPEQIVADERESAIKEMTANYAKNSDTLAAWAAYVYDTLGYRKP